jgi:hypothetical protein
LPLNIDDGGRSHISGKSLCQSAHHKKKTVCTLLRVSHACGGADRRRKVGDFAVPVVADGQGDIPHTIKIGRGHTRHQSKS